MMQKYTRQQVDSWVFPDTVKDVLWRKLDKEIRRYCKKNNMLLITDISHHEFPVIVPEYIDETLGKPEEQVIFHAYAVALRRG